MYVRNDIIIGVRFLKQLWFFIYLYKLRLCLLVSRGPRFELSRDRPSRTATLSFRLVNLRFKRRDTSGQTAYKDFVCVRREFKRIDFEHSLDLILISAGNKLLKISYWLGGNFNAGRKRLYDYATSYTVHNAQRFARL